MFFKNCYNSNVLPSTQIKPDMDRYEEAKERAGDAFYAGPGTVVHGIHKDRKEAIEKMAKDIQDQVKKMRGLIINCKVFFTLFLCNYWSTLAVLIIFQKVTKREKFSRRRTFDEGADVDYINERNMKFNRKLERFYGEYTKDIKDNLERGTAI